MCYTKESMNKNNTDKLDAVNKPKPLLVSDDIQSAITTPKIGKAPGYDDIPAEMKQESKESSKKIYIYHDALRETIIKMVSQFGCCQTRSR